MHGQRLSYEQPAMRFWKLFLMPCRQVRARSYTPHQCHARYKSSPFLAYVGGVARRPAVPDYDMGHDGLWAMAVPLTPAEDQDAKEPASQISLREGWFAKGVTGGQRRAKRVKEELEALT